VGNQILKRQPGSGATEAVTGQPTLFENINQVK